MTSHDMNLVKVNYPEIWVTAYELFDTDEKAALDIIRKTVEAHNRGLIEV